MWCSSRAARWMCPIGCTRSVLLTSLSRLAQKGFLSVDRVPGLPCLQFPFGFGRQEAPERDERLAFMGCGPPLSPVAAPVVRGPSSLQVRVRGRKPPGRASLGLCQPGGSLSPAYSFVRSPSSNHNIGGCCLFCRNSDRSRLVLRVHLSLRYSATLDIFRMSW